MARTKQKARRFKTPRRRAPQNVIDLTQPDPQDEPSSIRTNKPTALSPTFNGRSSTVAVPQDPKTDPAYLFRQLALARSRASIPPSFSSKVPVETDAQDDDEEEEEGPDETPSPDEKAVKQRQKRKAKAKKERQGLEDADATIISTRKKENNKHEGAGKDHKKAKKAKDQAGNGAETPVESKKKPKEIKREPEDDQPATLSRKRKREKDHDTPFKAVDVETEALNKLRESLPSVRISKVTRDLHIETGDVPSDVAVLATAARETIIDLARQQIEETEQSYQIMQKELLRMLRKQKKKLARLEGLRSHESSDEEDTDVIDRAPPEDSCRTN